MAYTRPSASAADASWSGASAYTRLGASAADAVFGSGLITTGFVSTQIGTPKARITQAATGFVSGNFGTPLAPYTSTGSKSTQIGTPYGVFKQIGVASGFRSTVLSVHSTPLPVTGFCSTHVGTPYGVFWQIADATGFNPTTFGALAGWQHWNEVATAPTTRFGTPSTPTDRAQDVSSLLTGGFGTPLGTRRNLPNTAQRGSASGAMATRFGTPRAGWLQTGQAVGFISTYLGTPNGVRVQTASGFASGQFGTAVMTLRAHAPGFMPVRLGTPTVQIAQPVAGFANTIRWGLANAERSRTYKTYSFATTRLGQPTGFTRLNHPATGFTGGSFGAPTCHQRHRVLAVPPCVRLGTPLLKRITQC